MPTSESFRSSDNGPEKRRGEGMEGFTLVEILVVVFIIGLMSALVLPRISVLFERLFVAYRRDDVLRQLADLGPRAVRESRALHLHSTPDPEQAGSARRQSPMPAPEDVRLNLPSGWKVVLDAPINYRFDGVCSGGRVTLDTGSQRYAYRLSPPHCVPSPDDVR